MSNRVGRTIAIAVVVLALWVVGGVFAIRKLREPRPPSAGYTWQVFNPPLNRDFTIRCHIAVSPSGSIFVSELGAGLLRSKDGGQQWEPVGDGIGGWQFLEGRCSFWSVWVGPKGAIFAGTGRGVWRSTDDGEHWSIANTGVPTMVASGFAADSQGRIYTSGETGVFRSSDAGNHWKRVPKWQQESQGGSSIAVTREGTMFVGSDGVGLQRTRDDGVHWTNLTPEWVEPRGGPSCRFGGIAIDPKGRLYVPVSLLYYSEKSDARSESFIMRSSDGGDHWKRLYPGPRRLSCNTVAVDGKGRVIAGTDGGLFISSDCGEHWVAVDMPATKESFGLVHRGCSVASIATDSHGRVFAMSYAGEVFVGTPVKH